MSENELYRKLVDLYAGRELSAELELEMEAAALRDPVLSHEMMSLRSTVGAMKALNEPVYNEETHQRVLMKLYARGVDVRPEAPEPRHLQYHLPIQG